MFSSRSGWRSRGAGPGVWSARSAVRPRTPTIRSGRSRRPSRPRWSAAARRPGPIAPRRLPWRRVRGTRRSAPARFHCDRRGCGHPRAARSGPPLAASALTVNGRGRSAAASWSSRSGRLCCASSPPRTAGPWSVPARRCASAARRAGMRTWGHEPRLCPRSSTRPTSPAPC